MAEEVKITGTIQNPDRSGHQNLAIEMSVNLSLRDLLAAFALAGILAKGHGDEGFDAEIAGSDAYLFADTAIATGKDQPQ